MGHDSEAFIGIDTAKLRNAWPFAKRAAGARYAISAWRQPGGQVDRLKGESPRRFSSITSRCESEGLARSEQSVRGHVRQEVPMGVMIPGSLRLRPSA